LKQCLAIASNNIRGERREYPDSRYFYYHTVTCNPSPIHGKGNYHSGLPVRSVAVEQRGSCYYVASTGDDGRVILISFNFGSEPTVRELRNDPNARLNSVDVYIDSDRQILIANDAGRGKVELYRHSLKEDADCK